MNELETLQSTYGQLLARQTFDMGALDYAIMERHRPFLDQLARVENSAVTVFDMARQEHLYSSVNFSSLLGYSLEEMERGGNAYFNSRIHPDDFLELVRIGNRLMVFLLELPAAERRDYKAITEYRILNGSQDYIRVIEQHQALELDSRGNVWLSLGMVDISPNQEPGASFRSQLINYRTGQIVSLPAALRPDGDDRPALTGRERQVLGLIREGLLSKEISDLLSISIHTVNTHRQRILEKTRSNNMMEAIRYAQDLGVVAR